MLRNQMIFLKTAAVFFALTFCFGKIVIAQVEDSAERIAVSCVDGSEVNSDSHFRMSYLRLAQDPEDPTIPFYDVLSSDLRVNGMDVSHELSLTTIKEVKVDGMTKGNLVQIFFGGEQSPRYEIMLWAEEDRVFNNAPANILYPLQKEEVSVRAIIPLRCTAQSLGI